MGDILVGTASWADKSLVDSNLFYPKDAKTAEARLRHYASHFPLVEVDSSYYALPAAKCSLRFGREDPQAANRLGRGWRSKFGRGYAFPKFLAV